MPDKRTIWSIIGCLIWTVSFVTVSFIPELPKLFSSGDSSNVSRVLGDDFKHVWLDGWLFACFLATILVDTFIDSRLENSKTNTSKTWDVNDWSSFCLIALVLSSIVLIIARLWSGIKGAQLAGFDVMNLLIFFQISVGTVAKFLSFKQSELEFVPIP